MNINGTPKAELHCHLIGVIDPEILSIIKRNGYEILVDPGELMKLYPVKTKEDFSNWMSVIKPYQNKALSFLLPILSLHVERLVRQNVMYAELMISPAMFTQHTDSMLKECMYLQDWVKHCENSQIQVEFIMVIPRTINDTQLRKEEHMFIKLFRAGFICGVALVGLEDNESIERFAPIFRKLKNEGLGIEIHAGEHSDSHSVWEAIKYGCADRIGHGISLFSDPKLLKLIRETNTHIEFCITSNLMTGSVNKLEDHPILKARELQLNYSINTDDPGMFQCDLNHEYRIAVNNYGFSAEDFNRIYKNTLEARFQKELKYISTLLQK